MREQPVAITLLLAVMVTLAIGGIIFPAAVWLYPLEGRSEDDLSRLLRNSVAMFVTLVASFIAQKLIWKFFNRKTNTS